MPNFTYTTKTFKPNHTHSDYWVAFNGVNGIEDSQVIRQLQNTTGKGATEQAALDDLLAKASKIVSGK